MSLPKDDSMETSGNRLSVGMFSGISSTDDQSRGFLESIPVFRTLQDASSVPSEGFPMPNVSGIGVTNIIGLEFVKDPKKYDGEIFLITPLSEV